MYLTVNAHYKARFGCKVYKLTVDGGFTCPNRDGTLGTGGCIFCSGSGSGEFAEHPCDSLRDQLERAKKRVISKNQDGKYIAYFQSFTNTYGPVSVLEDLYTQAMAPDEIVGIAIGTRPDCLGPEVLSLLERLNQRKPIYVELGLQTVHHDSIRYIRRAYENDVYFQAVKALKAADIHVVTHIILGIPGETAQMAAETTRQAVAAGTSGIKFHLLHVLKGTDLERDFLEGKFSCLSMEEYGTWLKMCLAQVPDDVVIHRITGDGAKRDLVAPLWSADKKRVLNYLNKVLKE